MSGLFFEPIHFYLESTNLAVKLIFFFFGVLCLLFFTLAEDIIGSFEQQLLPPIDLARMNIIFRRYLVDSSMPLQRFNGYLGFKF